MARVCWGAFVFLSLWASTSRNETVALWLFDEPIGAASGSLLHDSGPKGCSLTLGRGAVLVPGKFGQALSSSPGIAVDVQSRGSPGSAGFAALLAMDTRKAGHVLHANPTDTRLNLGPHDWTLECWLRLDAEARDEGTIFEIGTGPRAQNDFVTRFTVLPGENAFSIASLSAEPDGNRGFATRQVEYPNPEGPPGIVAYTGSITLALRGNLLPREEWFHVAIVHAGEDRGVHLFINGRRRAVVALRISALPRGDGGYLSVGRDGRGQRPLPGALDELRISDRADYAADFAPPASFADGTRP